MTSFCYLLKLFGFMISALVYLVVWSMPAITWIDSNRCIVVVPERYYSSRHYYHRLIFFMRQGVAGGRQFQTQILNSWRSISQSQNIRKNEFLSCYVCSIKRVFSPIPFNFKGCTQTPNLVFWNCWMIWRLACHWRRLNVHFTWAKLD